MMFNEEQFEKLGLFYLGRGTKTPDEPLLYDARNLLTHAICVGMTGSGKTGLCVDLLEEAAIDGIPCIAIDPKGDIGNLALTFPNLLPSDFEPWVDAEEARRKGLSVPDLASAQAKKWKDGLASWGQSPERIAKLKNSCEVTIYTPGASAGRMISLLSSFAAPPENIRVQPDVMADRIESTVSGLLGLLGIDADPLQSPEHVFLSNLLGHYWTAGTDVDFVSLIRGIQKPPFDTIGIMDVDDVFPAKARQGLSMRLNTLLASPSFAAWMQGDALDIDKLLYTPEGKAKISVFSIAHLSDSERMFFVTLLLDRMLGWMRGQPGTTSLRAILYMDEVFGYLPPVAEPPSKKPLLTMLKQARAHGLGLVLATQNPADLDYKALSNAGTWFLGRLQTERDVARVVDGLTASGDFDRAALSEKLSQLQTRQFLLHSVHQPAPFEFETRWALSFLKGPLTRDDIQRLSATQKPVVSSLSPPTAAKKVAEPVAPILSNDLPVFYLPVRLAQPADSHILYRPMCYCDAVIHFENAKFGVSTHLPAHRIASFVDPPVLVDWASASAVEFDASALTQEGEQGAKYLDFPREGREPKVYKGLQKDLEDHLYRNQTFDVYECPTLKLSSAPVESAAAFQERVAMEVRTRRDAAVDKIRSKFQSKLEREEDQVARAQEKVDNERGEARQAQLDTAISFGSSIFDAFMGRSVRSGVRSTASRATKSARAQSDISRAEDAYARELEDVERVRQEMEAELREQSEKFGPGAFPVEVKSLSPRKTDVDVRFCGLVWVPYFEAADGRKMKAF
jgi:hypothetical protein